MKIGKCSCWQAINKVIACAAGDDLGFELRYRFLPDGDTSCKDNEGATITVSGDGFYLCLMEIDQSTSSSSDSIDVATDEVVTESVDITDDAIRNSCYIQYLDRDTKEEMEIHRDDASSMDSYGRRDFVIGQDDVPFIDTYDEAWKLAGVAINALKDVPATDRLTTQMMYHLEPNDMIDVTNPQLYTGSKNVGLTEVVHRFQPNGGPATKQGFTTTLTGVQDRITGSRTQFLSMTGESNLKHDLPPTIGSVEIQSQWRNPTNGDGYSETVFTVPTPPNVQIQEVEWRYATAGEKVWHEERTNGPSLTVKGLPPGVTVAATARAKIVGGAR